MVQQFMLKKDFFAQDLSLENPADSYFCFQLALLHSVPYFFALYQSPYLSLNTIFDSVSSNIDEVLSIDPSANVFVFGDFCHGTDRSGELCCNFSNNLTQMVNFPTHISDCDSHSSVPLDLFISSEASICCTMPFLPLGDSDHVVISVSNSQQDVPFHCTA